jgi:hypothetical protein
MEEGFMHIRFSSLVLTLGVLAFFVPRAHAQDVPDRIKTIQTNLANDKAAYDQLPDSVKKQVRPDHRTLQLSNAVSKMARSLGKGINPSWQPSLGWDEGNADENGLVQVNNPARDLRFSPFIGYTQTDASTARCGERVVVAFNDSGSILETLLSGSGGVSTFPNAPPGTGGISATGYATSHNGGASFNDRGAVPPGPDVNTMLMGRPSVACSDSSNFYMVQEARFVSPAGYLQPRHGIALSRSVDGGNTWSDPVAVAAPSVTDGLQLGNDFQDPRVAVDPSNHQRILISYVHVSLGECSVFLGGFLSAMYTVEVIISSDGGQTFSSPVEIDNSCVIDTNEVDVGARMAVASDGTAYVAWESSFGGLFPDSIRVASFAPTGRALPSVVVDGVFSFPGAMMFEPMFGFGILVGGVTQPAPALQGGFANTRGFDLAVDHSGGPKDGTVYVVWDDGRNGAFAAPELEDTDSLTYSFTDVFFSRSSDGGQTFTTPQQLNSDVQPRVARGHDHFRPVLAVDSHGEVAACWYDRRNDPQNYQFERFCSESRNAGASWKEFSIPGSLSNPSTQQDWLIGRTEMGRNDDLTTDFLRHDDGFLGGILWTGSSGMNPDIKFVKFQ